MPLINIKRQRTARRFSGAFLKSDVYSLLRYFIVHKLQAGRGEDLKAMVDSGANIRHVFDDGSTIHHRIEDSKLVDLLFEAEDNRINQVNTIDRTALMSAISGNRHSVCNNILAREPNVHHHDDGETSTLHIARWNRNSLSSSTTSDLPDDLDGVPKVIAIVARLLDHGADRLCHDKSRCPPTTGVHPIAVKLGLSSYIWVLEWVLMLKVFRGEVAANGAVEELIRIREFE